MGRLWILIAILPLIASGCSTMKSALALDNKKEPAKPIDNPFDAYQAPDPRKENIVLRSKKGDRSVEIELPGDHSEMTDFVVPVNPAFKDDHRAGSEGDPEMDQSYKDRPPSMADREITRTFPQATPEDEGARREIETGLGVRPAPDSAPEEEHSYLAALDHVKRLYRLSRFEAALLELEELLRTYPTDPRLHEMRGTLLDRLGRPVLALKSWNEALHLDPNNVTLRRYVERKQQKRSIASP